ncbi:MAG: hypothetical protein C0631_04020 [Sedimenticola sp.]|jgi:hypothetical protein|nr:MAG: hypothetical protein C0631_04020 [Sedimenticola sp.]
MPASHSLTAQRLAHQVKADCLEPHQQPTDRRFKTACDFYQRYMLKHPYLSDFHCYTELLHAALLEGDPTVISFCPQPFQLWIRKKRYTPDCYIQSEAQPRRVVELRPDGKMAEDQALLLVAYFQQYRMMFEVVSNESILARETEALNWLEIVRILYHASTFITTEHERWVLEALSTDSPSTLGDLIDSGDRERTYLLEIALFRLLHRGQIRAVLTDSPLDFDTEISL